MKRFRSISLAVIAMGAAAFAFTSCNIEEGGRSGKSGRVFIDVTTDSGIETKAGRSEVYETVDLSEEGLPFFLSMNKTVYNTSSAQTKGSVIVDDGSVDPKAGEKDITEIAKFDILARKNSDKSLYESISGEKYNTASYKDGKWEIDDEIDFNDSDALDFWAYSYEGTKPYVLAPETDANRQKKFSYTGVTPAKGDDGKSSRNDGTLMSDFLVANTSNQTAENNPVGIHFYHALAAVKLNVEQSFYKSTTEGGLGYRYLSVRISEVKNSGSATFDGNGAFTWNTDGSEKVVYEQVLYDGTNVASDAARTMFFIPQAAKDNLLFTFYITNAKDQEYILSTKSIGAAAFEAGYIYNYTIGNDVDGNVEVVINEPGFDHNEKPHVTVGLEASAAAYLRVAIVANWYTAGENGATAKAYAEYKGEIECGDNWRQDSSDGYYYYKYPVLGHTESTDLLTDFKCTGEEPESPFDLHVEMTILAQAVTSKQKGEDKFYNASWIWDSLSDDIRNWIIPVVQ